MTRLARRGSGSCSISPRMVGFTCHQTPKRSRSQPHGPCSPPADSFSQYCVDFGLGLAIDRQGNAVGELEVRAAVERGERLAVQLEVDRHHAALRAWTRLAVVRRPDDARVLEDRHVEVHGFLGPAFVGEEGGDSGHGPSIFRPALRAGGQWQRRDRQLGRGRRARSLAAKDEIDRAHQADAGPDEVQRHGLLHVQHGEGHENRQGDHLLDDLELRKL